MTRALAVGPAGSSVARPVRGPGRRDRRPEWWLPVVASAGWTVLVAAELGRVVGHGAHAARHAAATGHAHAAPAGPWSPVTDSAWLHHGVLTLAMVAVMLPLIAPSVRYAALRSPRASRAGVTVAVVTGWAGVWVVAGAAVGVVGALLTSAGGYAGMAAATSFAVGWQGSRTKRRSVARCHRVLAPPLAPAAARAAGRSFGRGLGRDCAAACLPMMLLMAVFGHALVVTVAVAAVAWYERRRRAHHDPAPGRTAVVLAAAGGFELARAAAGL